MDKPKTGMESMLRSLGLGEVLDAANQLAQSGAVQKIIEFADTIGETNAKLDAIIRHFGIAQPGTGTAVGDVEHGGLDPIGTNASINGHVIEPGRTGVSNSDARVSGVGAIIEGELAR